MSVQACYRNRRVLVTGMTGFKGIWLGLWLRELGADVQGLALPATPEMHAGWPGLASRLPCRHGDIRDASVVNKAFADFQPEIVFHLAAQPLVRLSYQDPVKTYATNVMGTAHVLDAARQTSTVKATVVVTTDKCYENREWHWGYREDDPVGGFDPYSSSKACAEILSASYRRAFSDQAACGNLATARAGNVIGGGDWAEDRLIPDMVRAMFRGDDIFLRRPLALRPWQHVLEPLSGYLLLGASLMKSDASAAAWNFGPIDIETLTVRDVAERFVKNWGQGHIIEADAQSGPHEAHYLKLDSSKAVSNLNWRPILNAEDRISWTVDWYKTWQENPKDIWEFTRTQIRQAESKIARVARFAEVWNDTTIQTKAA